MINLSASAIKDYLDCSKKWYWRKNFPESAIQTQEMAVGTIVHKITEDYWNKQDEGLAVMEKLLVEYGIDTLGCKRAIKCVTNFYNNYTYLLSDNDKSELDFRIPIEKGIFLVGKIDKIANGHVIDWKTGGIVPKSIDNDIQFIIYDFAYKSLIGSAPNSVMLINLNKDQIVQYHYNPRFVSALFGEVIPSMLRDIKAGSFYREGMVKNSCQWCSYLSICWEGREE